MHNSRSGDVNWFLVATPDAPNALIGSQLKRRHLPIRFLIGASQLVWQYQSNPNMHFPTGRQTRTAFCSPDAIFDRCITADWALPIQSRDTPSNRTTAGARRTPIVPNGFESRPADFWLFVIRVQISVSGYSPALPKSLVMRASAADNSHGLRFLVVWFVFLLLIVVVYREWCSCCVCFVVLPLFCCVWGFVVVPIYTIFCLFLSWSSFYQSSIITMDSYISIINLLLFSLNQFVVSMVSIYIYIYILLWYFLFEFLYYFNLPAYARELINLFELVPVAVLNIF